MSVMPGIFSTASHVHLLSATCFLMQLLQQPVTTNDCRYTSAHVTGNVVHVDHAALGLHL